MSTLSTAKGGWPFDVLVVQPSEKISTKLCLEEPSNGQIVAEYRAVCINILLAVPQRTWATAVVLLPNLFVRLIRIPLTFK